MKLAYKISFLVSLLFTSIGIVSAQAFTGTPPFGTFEGGPLDTVDLGNLNAQIYVPIFSKPGRGTPLTFELNYNTSVWYPSSIFGGSIWTQVGSFGWQANTTAQLGYVTSQATTTTDTCMFAGRKVSGNHYWFSNYQYHDKLGTAHPFIGTASEPYGLCSRTFSGFVATSADGSGYTINVQSATAQPLVTKAGAVVLPPQQNTFTGAGTDTDQNGNMITTNSSGTITDTLGTTALTIAGSGTPSSPMTYSYTAPSGATAGYTVKYAAYTVKTNFGCSGTSEWGPASLNLISEIDLPDQGVIAADKYTLTYEATPGFPGDVTGRIASVTYPTGATISYTYTGGNNGIECADGSIAGLTRQTPDGTWTYSRNLGTGAASTTTVTDPQGNQTVINFQFIYPTETQVYQGSTSGTLLKTVYTCYNGAASPCNGTAISPPITQMTNLLQWPGGLESKTTTSYDTTYGRITENDEYAYGSGAPGALVRKTLTTYATLSNNIVDKPSTVTVEDASGNIKAQTTYCYDEGVPSGTTTCAATGSPTATSGTPQHASVTGSRGNLTTIAQLVSGSTTLGKTSTYYDTGNVNVATDVNGAQTSYTYGACGNSFPTAISEPLSLSESMMWNCAGAVVTSATDENGKTFSTSYTDAYYWRQNSTTDASLNTFSLAYGGQTFFEGSMNFNGSSSTVDVRGTLDSSGRPSIFQTKESPSSTTYDSVEADYDSGGRSTRFTLPYAGTAGQTSSSAAGTTTTYDALSRPIQVSDSGGGSTTNSYPQNDTYVSAAPAPSGENTKRKQFEYDALGRLTSVCEVTNAAGSGTCGQTSPVTGYWTEYSYDLNNNLTGVTQNAQSSTIQTRTYVYDDLGRMTSETNPESGTTTYTYDTDSTCGTSKGDSVKKTDAAGDTICYGHDVLHRMTSTTYLGTYASVTPSRYFVYDSATVNGVAMVNAKSHLAEAYTCFSPCTSKLTDIGLSYTARGESSDVYESTPHSGAYYHVTESYWANGAINQISGLPGLPTITYNVDGEGRISSASASSGQNPLSSTAYSVASFPTAISLGSSDSDSFVYDPNTNRMTKYTFSVNSQSVIGNLTWNAVGTLGSLAITDPFDSSNAQTCSYSHDDLTRIASANCGSIWAQTFSYDAFGNINKSGSSSFGATYSTSTNRMTVIGSSTPSYDSNGNVTNDFLHTYTWDANGRPVTADSVGLTYDALGRMVEQNRSGTYTQLAYTPTGTKLAQMNSSTLQMGFVPLSGGSMAVYSSSGLAYYRHSDWIGSSRFASTPNRTMYSDGAYGPFAEPYAQAGTMDLAFTGMNQDTASSLYDFPDREYGTQGRWPSPDPAGIASLHQGDPQTLNRYAYVRNSPLMFTDPTGQDLDGGDGIEGDCSGDPTCVGSIGNNSSVFSELNSLTAFESGANQAQASNPCATDPNTCVFVTATYNTFLTDPGPDPSGCGSASINGGPASVCLGMPPFAGTGGGGGGAGAVAGSGANGHFRQRTKQEYDACMQNAASKRDSAILGARLTQFAGGALTLIGVATAEYSVPTLSKAFFQGGFEGGITAAHTGGFVALGTFGPLGFGLGTFALGTYNVAAAWNQYYADEIHCGGAVPNN